MNDNQYKPWLSSFLGASEEFDSLKKRFESVVADKKPYIAVILGESGSGKTRLVQEFYSWLVKRHNEAETESYWPEKFTNTGNNLAINPSFEDIEINWRKPPSFIWWGLRFVRIIERNNVESNALNSYLPYIIPHFYSFELERNKNEMKKQIIKSTVQVGMDISLNFVTLGFVGFIKTAVDAGMKVKDIIDYSTLVKNFQGERAYSSIKEKKDKSISESLIHDLSEFFTLTAKEKPFVLVLDDAQWAKYDESTLPFLGRFFEEAFSKSWPVLIIITSWSSDWSFPCEKPEAVQGSEEHSVEGFIARYCTTFQDERDVNNTIVSMKKNKQLNQMLDHAFPGLAKEQKGLILNRADGNPQLLDEIICYYRQSPHLFESNKLTKSLKSHGLDLCLTEKFNYDHLVRSRFMALPVEAKRVIGAATLHGSMTFSSKYLKTMFNSIGSRINVVKVCNELSEKYYVTEKSQTGMTEFRHKSYYEAARAFFESDREFNHKFSNENISLSSIEDLCLGSDYDQLNGNEKKWLLQRCIPYRMERIVEPADMEKFASLNCRMIDILLIENEHDGAIKYFNSLFSVLKKLKQIEKSTSIKMNYIILKSTGLRDVFNPEERSKYWKQTYDKCLRISEGNTDVKKDAAECLGLLGRIALANKDFKGSGKAFKDELELLDKLNEYDIKIIEQKINNLFYMMRLHRIEKGTCSDKILKKIDDIRVILSGNKVMMDSMPKKIPSYSIWLEKNITANIGTNINGSLEIETYLVYSNDAGSIAFFINTGMLYGYEEGPYTYKIYNDELHVIVDNLKIIFPGLDADLIENLNKVTAIMIFTVAENSPSWNKDFDKRLFNKKVHTICVIPAYNSNRELSPVTWAEMIGVKSDKTE